MDRHSTQQNIHSLLSKLDDPDPDIRYMSLNDLLGILNGSSSSYLSTDPVSSTRLVDGLLKSLQDQHGEVQSQALKCLSPLAVRISFECLCPLVEKLTNLTASQSIDTSIPNTALTVIITALPSPQPGQPPSQEATAAYSAISRVLIPRLTGQVQSRSTRRDSIPRGMLEKDPSKGYSSDAIDVVVEVVNCFGSLLKETEVASLQKSVMAIIENDTAATVVTKRALAAISALILHFSDSQLNTFVSQLIDSFRSPQLTVNRRRHLTAAIGSLARSAPLKFGPYLKTLASFVLSPVNEQESEDMNEDDSDDAADELRETALVTLDTLLASCSQEMQPYLMNSINSALRYLRYDPNIAELEEDEEMGGTMDEGSEDGATEEPDDGDDEFDDFEEEGGYSDIDDMSWKVRRCASKMLHTVVSTYGSSRFLEDGILYQQVAPALISRFGKEREESVKLEVVATLTALVRKTSEGTPIVSSNGFTEPVGGSKNSRKRRRQDSFASTIDFEPSMGSSSAINSPVLVPSSPEPGPQADLARLVPSILQSLVKIWKRASVSLKQAAIVLLKSLALVRYGGLADYLQQIEDPIADALKTPISGSTVTTGSAVGAGTLQIETLSLIAAIAETHTSNALLPFLIALTPGVVASVNDRNYRVASEALGAIEQFIKALTPPRVSANEQDLRLQLEKLYEVIVFRITDTSADLEVRQRAIHVFGVLLARTSGVQGAKFISPPQRLRGLSILVDRLKNETTRLSTARAIDNIAVLACSEQDASAAWISEVTTELGAQLRKSDRTLRSSCLEALRSLAMNPYTRAYYDRKTLGELENLLLPLLSPDDFHLLAPALIILAKIVPGNAQALVNDGLISSLCSIVVAPLVGTALKALLLLVKVIGEQSAGAELMKRLLRDVGINGDPAVVGRAIGTLLVHGGPNLGVKMEDFLTELRTAQDNQRKCLALAILGEFCLRMGADCPLTPDLFISNFQSKSDKVRLAAAIALGNAAASSIKTYMPVILEELDKSSSSNYLLLHSVKEVLQHPENVRSDIVPFAMKLWGILLTASDDEDNRVVGAECIGRLALIDPVSYVPHLQECLSSQNPTVRGTVISAFRYTLSDSSSVYHDVLRPLIIPMLVNMLSDRDLGNHRLALTTLNSAIHNKMDIILPHLSELLPAVIGDTHIKPELIREVQMGPFKHKVDDGLELRKSAYETLYACLDSAFSRINVSEFLDRILAGVEDEQDIRALCNLMTVKLIALAPEETQRQLDALSERYRVVLSFRPKDNAVKQDLEKAEEASLGILKISRELEKAFPTAESSGEHLKWKAYMDWIRKTFALQLRSLEVES
ncbi:Armadillo-type fold [Elaphomyces granulatus]